MQQQFTIIGKFPDLNTYIKAERSNKYAGAKIKQDWTTIVWQLAKEARLKPMKLPVKAYITFYVKSRRRDKDNLLINTKWIMDGLVHAGVLRNDGWDAIEDISFAWYLVATEEMIHVLLEND